MDRRKFLSGTGALIAGASLNTRLFGRGLPDAPSDSAIASMTLPINQDWRWNVRAPAGFEQPGFDDSSFEQICIPLSIR